MDGDRSCVSWLGCVPDDRESLFFFFFNMTVHQGLVFNWALVQSIPALYGSCFWALNIRRALLCCEYASGSVSVNPQDML